MALAGLGLTSLAARYVPGMSTVSDAVGRALAPVQQTLTAASGRVREATSGTRELEALRQRNAELETQNAQLQADNLRLTSLERELRDLREKVGFKNERPDLDLLGASIVATRVGFDPGHLTHAIKLDAGRRQGLKTRMTVASQRGLIGQVVRVAETWSDVLLITDPSSAVAGRIQRTGEAGMVFGSPTGEIVMRYIPQDHPDTPPNVQTGDLVYTSSHSQRFPPSLLIGQVIEVRQSDFETFQEAVVRPSVDLNALETVLVVTRWAPDATLSEEIALPDGPSAPAEGSPPGDAAAGAP